MNLKTTLKKLFEKLSVPYWGIIGIIILTFGFLIPSIAYTGEKGEAYSFLNHAISELGELGVSELAIMFNIFIFFGAIFALVFFIGLSLYIDNIISRIGGIIGVVSSLGGVFVGVFPMNFPGPHYIAAMTFFFGGMLTVFVFSLALLFDKEKKIHWIFSILGFIVALFFALFLFYPYAETYRVSGALSILYNLFYERPTFLLPFFFEWMTLITIMIWVGTLSIVFIIQKVNLT
jgi:hypothetical membrane protein